MDPASRRLKDRLALVPPGLRRVLVIEFILARLKAELGDDGGDEIHARCRFADTGVDSKRALEFKEVLAEIFARPLPATLLFDYPTPERLAFFLLGAEAET